MAISEKEYGTILQETADKIISDFTARIDKESDKKTAMAAGLRGTAVGFAVLFNQLKEVGIINDPDGSFLQELVSDIMEIAQNTKAQTVESAVEQVSPSEPLVITPPGAAESKSLEEGLYDLALHCAIEAAEDIFKDLEKSGVVGEDKNAEKMKLQFDLSVAFISETSSIVYKTQLSEVFKKEVMDGICDLYSKDLEKVQDDPQYRIEGEFFVRDADEREFCRKSIIQKLPNVKVEKLPMMNLYTLAGLLFNKRFLEYQKLAELDELNVINNVPGQLPKMARKVYEHYSGTGTKSPEGLIFSLQLEQHLVNFSLRLTKTLNKYLAETTGN